MPLFRLRGVVAILLLALLSLQSTRAESNARAAANVPTLSSNPIAPAELTPLSKLPEAPLVAESENPEQPR